MINMKRVGFLFVILLSLFSHTIMAKTPKSISCQAYSFKNFTFEEALGKINQLGIKTVEMYPNQTVIKGED